MPNLDAILQDTLLMNGVRGPDAVRTLFHLAAGRQSCR
jgi:hypothetical protein